jgi:hypothetical protein
VSPQHAEHISVYHAIGSKHTKLALEQFCEFHTSRSHLDSANNLSIDMHLQCIQKLISNVLNSMSPAFNSITTLSERCVNLKNLECMQSGRLVGNTRRL